MDSNGTAPNLGSGKEELHKMKAIYRQKGRDKEVILAKIRVGYCEVIFL